MGTRGAMGFRINEKDYLAYNHFDSYPEGLGVDVLKEINDSDIEELKKLAGKVKLVDEDVNPTEEEVSLLNKYLNVNVGQSLEDTKKHGVTWYQLLRELQGELAETIKSGYMISNSEFINDSLFCEWAYIVNFDENTLEVYEGFQSDKNKIKGRYKDFEPNDDGRYYACSLVKTYSLDNLPTEEEFVKEFEEEEDED